MAKLVILLTLDEGETSASFDLATLGLEGVITDLENRASVDPVDLEKALAKKSKPVFTAEHIEAPAQADAAELVPD